MGKFDVLKRLNLSFLGSDWENCEIVFKAVSVGQVRSFAKLPEDELLDKGIELMSTNFVSGSGISNGKKVELKKTDIEDLPISVINKAIEILVEDVAVDKKK